MVVEQKRRSRTQAEQIPNMGIDTSLAKADTSHSMQSTVLLCTRLCTVYHSILQALRSNTVSIQRTPTSFEFQDAADGPVWRVPCTTILEDASTNIAILRVTDCNVTHQHLIRFIWTCKDQQMTPIQMAR